MYMVRDPNTALACMTLELSLDFRKTVFGAWFGLKRGNYTLLQGFERPRRPQRPPGLHFTPFALARESFPLSPRGGSGLKIAGSQILSISFPQKVHFFHIFACNILLKQTTYIPKNVNMAKRTQSNPF